LINTQTTLQITKIERNSVAPPGRNSSPPGGSCQNKNNTPVWCAAWQKGMNRQAVSGKIQKLQYNSAENDAVIMLWFKALYN